tara:strand:- start:613 stop:816 length:204 start_codon:yes stop_codon:yes gene_type:complete
MSRKIKFYMTATRYDQVSALIGAMAHADILTGPEKETILLFIRDSIPDNLRPSHWVTHGHVTKELIE